MEEILLNIWPQFNNRERAVLVWIWIIGFLFLLNKEIRKSIKPIFSKFFFQIIFIILTYNSITTYILYQLWLWNLWFFKESLYWSFWTSFVLMNDAPKWMSSIRKFLFSAISLTAIITFLWNLKTFSFLLEIILQPILILLWCMAGFLEINLSKNPNYKNALTILNFILIILWIIFLSKLFFNIYGDYSVFLNSNNLYLFFYPVLYFILYYPFLYFLRLWVLYEGLFIRINPAHAWWAKNARRIKYGIIKFCHVNLSKLNKFSEFFGRNYFLQEKPTIDTFISNFNKQL